MPILVFCSDSDDAATLREQHLHAHFEYIESILDQLRIAGPNSKPSAGSDTQRGKNYGSTFIYSTDDLDVAQRLFNNDPYAKHGVYKHVEFHHFLPAAGSWIGGKVWN